MNKLAEDVQEANDSYLSALRACEDIAREEFNHSQSYSEQCDDIVNKLNEELTDVIRQAEKVTTRDQMSANGLNDLKVQLGEDYQVTRAKQQLALEQQKSRLSKFSVMLFGRTMAGKSTIREAITRGDGSTIGKGAQRTTRDVIEYEWNHLRIIDTPGFGAYNGEEDTEIARSILEQSDVILFMLNSDSIQQSTLTELEYVYKLNKPLIFVINVKKDLTKSVYRRKAIKDPESYLYDETKLSGHQLRLREEASKLGLNPKRIHVVSLHAQAAFLSTQAEFLECAEGLHRASRLDELLQLLSNEIEQNGRVRRIQTLLGSALNHASHLDDILAQQNDAVRSLLKHYEHTMTRIYRWHTRTLERIPKKIDRQLDTIYNPLLDSVSGFVDDNIQSKAFSPRLDRHVGSFKLDDKFKRLTKNIAEEIKDDISEFNRSLEVSINLTGKVEGVDALGGIDPFDYKRMNGWGAALAGVLATVAFANSWNPVGWGLAVAGIAFSVFSMFSDSKEKKLQEEKRNRSQAIREQLNEQKRSISKKMKRWFETDMDAGVIRPLKSDVQEICKGFSQFSGFIKSAISNVDDLESDINKRWLVRVIAACDKVNTSPPPIERIIRQPGYACYFTVSGFYRQPDLLRSVSAVVGEKIKVVYSGATEGMIRHVLGVRSPRVEIKKTEGGYVIYAPEEQIGLLVGKRARNIKIASAVCNVSLWVRPIYDLDKGVV
tara:strand:+ start:30027 stop:32177 length:2151 start_codon:yes stop_codon:yes gene_type:complete